jgi:hypothetical protein
MPAGLSPSDTGWGIQDARAALTILQTLNEVVLADTQIELKAMEGKALELERDVRVAIERAKPSHRTPIPSQMYG